MENTYSCGNVPKVGDIVEFNTKPFSYWNLTKGKRYEVVEYNSSNNTISTIEDDGKIDSTLIHNFKLIKRKEKEMGSIFDFDVEEGDVVIFEGFSDPIHSYWSFEVGKEYPVRLYNEAENLLSVFDEEGESPILNWGFIFKKKENMFTKSDLKPGMFVTLRDNRRYVVFNDDCMLTRNYGVADDFALSRIKVNLDHDCAKDCDIVRVEFDGEIIWERGTEEEKEKRERIEKLEEIVNNTKSELTNAQEEINKLKGDK